MSNVDFKRSERKLLIPLQKEYPILEPTSLRNDELPIFFYPLTDLWMQTSKKLIEGSRCSTLTTMAKPFFTDAQIRPRVGWLVSLDMSMPADPKGG